MTTPPSPDWTTEAPWAGTRSPLERSRGLPPAAYTDDTFFERERELVFERSWVAVAEVADLDATPGETRRPMLVRRLGRRSIVIVRDDAGELRAFVNSCRHRGTELAETDCKIGRTIRCPYHRWGYALDGHLVATPRFDDVHRPDHDPADLGLVPVRVDSWAGIVFACIDPRTPPLAEWLGDLPERMAGYGLDGWQPHEQRALDIDSNWKLIAENFAEYYHLAWVHPELAKVSRVSDHYRYQGPGMYCGQTTTPVSGDDRDDWLTLPVAEGLDESDSESGRFVVVFPNLLLSVLPNHAFVMRLEPDAPGRTTEVCTFFLPPSNTEVDEQRFATTRSFWFDVNDEDIDIVERSQRGLTGGQLDPGPLAPRFEEPLHRFHNMLADCFTAPDPSHLAPPPGDGAGDAERLGSGANPNPPAIDRKPATPAPTGPGAR